ncbi:MAG: CHAD domain-containing protein [Solirubrobacterales bacterium]
MKAKRVKKLDPAQPLAENAARIVGVRLRELRSFAPAALEPDASREQHDMRIAAKRLRYVLEATEFCFGRPGRTARRRARDLQNVLGEVHDCDVMLPRIEDQSESLRRADAAAVRERAGDADDLDPALSAKAGHRTAYRGLDVLAVHVGARRRLLFDRFRELWAAQEHAGTWDRLERAAESTLRSAGERREAAERAARAAEELARAQEAEREAAERARRAAAELADARRDGGGGAPERV